MKTVFEESISKHYEGIEKDVLVFDCGLTNIDNGYKYKYLLRLDPEEFCESDKSLLYVKTINNCVTCTIPEGILVTIKADMDKKFITWRMVTNDRSTADELFGNENINADMLFEVNYYGSPKVIALHSMINGLTQINVTDDGDTLYILSGQITSSELNECFTKLFSEGKPVFNELLLAVAARGNRVLNNNYDNSVASH